MYSLFQSRQSRQKNKTSERHENFRRGVENALQQAGDFCQHQQNVFIPGIPAQVSLSLDVEVTPSPRGPINGDNSHDSLMSSGRQSSSSSQGLGRIQLNIIDPYRDLVPKLGHTDYIAYGGFSIVSKHLYRGQEVVAKDLTSDVQFCSDDLFFKELHINCLHNHPNIMRLIGASVKPGQRVIVVEYVDYDLRTFIHDRLQEERTKKITLFRVTRGIASALEHLHSRGIAHRDLHPQNIRITKNGIVKVGDVGIAKLFQQHSSSYNSQSHGVCIYLAPELFNNRVHRKSDMYSLATIIAEMCTRQKPWMGQITRSGIQKKILEGERPISELPSDMPPALREIVERCWQLEYRKRYSAEEVVRICDEQLEFLEAQKNQGGDDSGQGSWWGQNTPERSSRCEVRDLKSEQLQASQVQMKQSGKFQSDTTQVNRRKKQYFKKKK